MLLFQIHFNILCTKTLAVVAASAVAGKIASPAFLSTSSYAFPAHQTPIITCDINQSEQPIETSSIIEPTIPGFPGTIKGELIFCDADNLNTDGIYPGKYTYVDDLTLEQMAKVVMENYDPKFANIVSKVINKSEMYLSIFISILLFIFIYL